MTTRDIKLALFGVAAMLHLSGCATLPISGPAGADVRKSGRVGSFKLVEVDAPSAIPVMDQLAQAAELPTPGTPVANAIAPGDVISVTIYEVGVRLFSGAGAAGQGTIQQFDPSARGERIASLPVDEQGNIRLPYIGTVQAAGMTTTQLASEIERRLRGKSEAPQVTVLIEQPIGGSVIVSGEVSRPGRVPLTGARERLLDIVSLAGGYRGRESELMVRIERAGVVYEAMLSDLTYDNLGGTAVVAGDRVDIIYRPRSYSILGTANKIDHFTFTTANVSLVEAIAKAGGMNDNLADPAAVFVFRFENNGNGEIPVVYHVNMLRPLSYLLSQKFMLRDKDVIYVAGAAANRPSKLVRIISELFTPALLTRQLAN